MGRRATAVWATIGLVVGAVVLVLVVGANQDQGGPTVNTTDRPLDPVTYAVRVTNTCDEGLAAAENAGYDDSSQAGAEAMRDLAGQLAAIPPPDEQRAMAQALVDGVADYAHLFQVRDDNGEAFSQAQNELIVVLEARARGLGARCTTGDGEDAELLVHDPSPADPSEIAATGESDLSDLAAACFAGELATCDELAESKSPLVFYGVTCGGRLFHEEADDRYTCVETLAGDRPSGDQS